VTAQSQVGRIRQAGLDDARVIAEIHVSSWRAAYAGQLPDQFLEGLSIQERDTAWQLQLRTPPRGSRVLLVEREPGHVVGFASVGACRDQDADQRAGELHALYVHPDHWGRGLGRLLHDHAMNDLRQAGFRTATLWVLRTHHAAQRFYANSGWTPDGCAKVESVGEVALAEVRYTRSLSA
jgi:GNAT superfamily N-acetyltransferase